MAELSKGPKQQSAIAPTRKENFSEWYQMVIKGADLAETSPVRGAMIIKPWGCALWEQIKALLNEKIEASGHENVYFPLLIPLHLIEKEAEHVAGFAKECAVVTHQRLKADNKGGLIPDGALDEPLIIRPTSEVLIGEAFSRWIHSYRDLPLKINQWANIVRWEMRTRPFLRTSEFLWQEGHTAHATEKEASAQTLASARIYEDLFTNTLALAPFCGEKSPLERFPGAKTTITLEGMMQDGKALQLGTSHNLGVNFAKAANMSFSAPDGQLHLPHTTSWGLSTRIIGALIMTHGDDDGLVLPPAIAPLHIVLLPMLHKQEHRAQVIQYCQKLQDQLRQLNYLGGHIRVKIDLREERGGGKLWSWIKKGVPLFIEIGPKEVETDLLSLGRRDEHRGEKLRLMRRALCEQIPEVLSAMQETLRLKAETFAKKRVFEASDVGELAEIFNPCKSDDRPLGFALCHWCGDASIETKLAEQFKVTTRCLPLSERGKPGTCIFTGRASPQRVLIAKAY